jgi:nickel-dependent lactate racemase
LPPAFEEVHVEVHDPKNRRQLSYLAATRQGRRIYLNRTAVDADQLVVMGRRRYDPLLGYSGSEGALYPALSDEATIKEMWGRLSLDAPGEDPWPVRQEALEVVWLLGAPFMVQIIEGAGEDIVHIVSGLRETGQEGQRLLNACWRTAVDAPADTVIAGIGGDPARHGFAELARALACAARVVKPQGRIVLLSRARAPLGAGAESIRKAGDPARALTLLRQESPADMVAAFQWASTVEKATVYLLSDLPPDLAEELFTTPLEHARQVQRLLGAREACLFLPDAHKALTVVDTMAG